MTGEIAEYGEDPTESYFDDDQAEIQPAEGSFCDNDYEDYPEETDYSEYADESNQYYDGFVSKFEDNQNRPERGRPSNRRFNRGPRRGGFENRGSFRGRQFSANNSNTGGFGGNQQNQQHQQKQYPKPGYAMIDGKETMIVDLERVKRVPCLLDGKNHALADCQLTTSQRMGLFAEKLICQKCLQKGHLYFKCPNNKLIRPFCEGCKRPGHWDFCCWRTIDQRTDERESGQKAGNITPTVSMNKFIPANELAEAIISRIGNEAACKYQASGKKQ
jgi:hypothetical protein